MTVFSILRRVGIWHPPVPAARHAIPRRRIIGFGFLQHGYAKLVRGPEAFIAILHAIGMPLLLVAIVTVHLPNGFRSIKLLSYDATGAHFGQPGYETVLLYLSGLLALRFGGAGPFSVDRYLRSDALVSATTRVD
jgi:putative oxidoreductase